MIKRIWQGLLGVILLAATPAAFGSEIYVVRFSTPPVLVEPPCTVSYYRDELVFYNTTPDERLVRLLGVSNGGTVDNPQDLVLGRGRLAAASSFGSDAVSSWTPSGNPILWVAHLEVPAGVQLTSRLLLGTYPTLSCAPPRVVSQLRKDVGGRMPVVKDLTPPGVPQVHLGTDLGSDELGRTANGRTNVGIYNAGAAIAHATVEVRRVCDGRLIASVAAEVPPNSVTQQNGLPPGGDGCPSFFDNFEHYVIVTADQPSFSYVVTLSNEQPFMSMGTSP